MPGFGVQLPLVHITRVRDIREHTMDIEPQPVITKDNVEINVVPANAEQRIVEAVLAVLSVGEKSVQVQSLVNTA